MYISPFLFVFLVEIFTPLHKTASLEFPPQPAVQQGQGRINDLDGEEKPSLGLATLGLFFFFFFFFLIKDIN